MKQIFTILSTSILQRGSVVFLMFIAARSLSNSDFGIFAFIYSTIVSLTSFVGDTIATSVYRFFPSLDQNSNIPSEKSNSFLNLSLLTGIFCGLVIGLIVLKITKNDSIQLTIISALMSLIFIVSPTVFALLNKINKLSIALISNILGTALMMVRIYSPQEYGGVTHYLSAALTGPSLALLINILILWNNRFLLKNSCNNETTFLATNIQLKFLLSTGLRSALGGPIHWCCIYFLSISTNGIDEVGKFTVFFQWYLIITFIPSSLSGFTIPWLTRYAEKLDTEIFKAMAWRLIKITSIFGVVVIFCGLLLNEPILKIYGDKYLDDQRIFFLAILTASITSIVTITNQIYSAAGKALRSLTYTIIYSIVYLSSSAILTMYFEIGANALYISILLALLMQLSAQFFSQGFFFEPSK